MRIRATVRFTLHRRLVGTFQAKGASHHSLSHGREIALGMLKDTMHKAGVRKQIRRSCVAPDRGRRELSVEALK